MRFINFNKDKYGVRFKYPSRTCKGCNKYPCFDGIDKCSCDFAKYGCTFYTELRSKEWL